MSTKEDWMAAVASGKCTLGLLDYVRQCEEARRLATPTTVDTRQMEFNLEALIKTRKAKHPGPARTVRKG